MDILSIYDRYNHFGRKLNMTYKIITPGEVEYSLEVTKDLLATRTAAHGGALAGFMDAIVGVAALSQALREEKVVSTVEFKINYLQAALLGDRLTGKGKVIKAGKRLLITEGKIFNQSGDLLCTAMATLNAYPFLKSDMHDEVTTQ